MRIVLILFLSTFALLQAQVPYFTEAMLNDPIVNKDQWDKFMIKSEVPVFSQNPLVNSILLPNDYVSSKLTNTSSWPVEKKYIILAVKIIFTKYPENFEEWKVNYYQLMADRFKALFKVDPRFNDKKINYRVVLQTGCKNEKEAQSMFHGFEILYQKTPPFNNKTNELELEGDLKDYIEKKGGVRGLSVLRTFQSLNVDSSLIVIDCTGSMDPYKNQILMWLSLNMDGKNKYFSLMNDDRSLGDTIGHSGGVYPCMYKTPEEVMAKYDSLNYTLRNNPDQEENNVEAILAGIKRFPFVKSVIMLADMESCVRDINFANCIPIPVHILADDYEKFPNPHYLYIAAMSGGSFYMGNNNWLTAESILRGDEITIGNNTYRYDKSLRRVTVNLGPKSYSYRWMDCNKFYDGPGCK